LQENPINLQDNRFGFIKIQLLAAPVSNFKKCGIYVTPKVMYCRLSAKNMVSRPTSRNADPATQLSKSNSSIGLQSWSSHISRRCRSTSPFCPTNHPT